jgi:hypothetical protein
MRLHHCWHNTASSSFCCRCDKRTKRKVRNYYTKDGLVELTCKLSKLSFMWAEGYRK